MEDHYDLAYAKSMKAMSPNVIAQVAAEGLTPAHLEQVAAQVEAALQAMET